MTRNSRTFKIRLSPSGMDLLIDCHCHLIRSTRSLLAWGTTLHVAVVRLDGLAPEDVARDLSRLPAASLMGTEEHHLGAPKGLNDIAVGIARRVAASAQLQTVPTQASIYLLALHGLLNADRRELQHIFETLGSNSGSALPG